MGLTLQDCLAVVFDTGTALRHPPGTMSHGHLCGVRCSHASRHHRTPVALLLALSTLALLSQNCERMQAYSAWLSRRKRPDALQEVYWPASSHASCPLCLRRVLRTRCTLRPLGRLALPRSLTFVQRLCPPLEILMAPRPLALRTCRTGDSADALSQPSSTRHLALHNAVDWPR